MDGGEDSSQSQLPGLPEPAQLEAWQELARAAWHYARASKASNTLRAYRSDLANFVLWCTEHGRTSLPADAQTLSLYIADLAQHGAKVATIQRRLAAISQAHQLAGITPSPTGDWAVKATMAGIRRTHGVAPDQKAALLTPELRRLLAHVPDETLAGRRDRALLLIGFAGAFRRSELVALDVDDVVETSDGLRVTIGASKTDQEGEGRELGIPFGQHPETCPVRALRTWKDASGITDGPLFRAVTRYDRLQDKRLTAQSVALVVKRAAERAGFNPEHYAGHSLRSGLATSAADGTSQCADGAALYPQWLALPGECGSLRRVVKSRRLVIHYIRWARTFLAISPPVGLHGLLPQAR